MNSAADAVILNANVRIAGGPGIASNRAAQPMPRERQAILGVEFMDILESIES